MKRGAIAVAGGAIALAAAVALATREHDPVERGRKLAAEGKAERAFVVWTRACEQKNARACAAKGAAFVESGDVESARAMSTLADAIDPRALEAMLLRAALAQIDDQLDAARDVYAEAETLHPYSGVPSANLAMMDLADGDVESATAHVDRALEANPNLAMGYAVRGRIFTAHGEPAGAESAFRMALSLDPRPLYRVELADALAAIPGKEAERERLLAAAVKEAPEDVDVRIAWGQALGSAGKYEKAIEELRKAAELDPKKIEPHLYLAEIFLNDGKPEFAEARLKEALKIEPTSVGAAVLLADSLIDQSRDDDAIAVLDGFLARSDLPQNTRIDLLMRRASIRAKQGKTALARKDLDAILAIAPANSDAHLLHGSLALEEKKYAAARTHLESSMAESPESPRAIFDHARALAGLGELDLALVELQALSYITPLRPEELKAQPEFAKLADRREFRLLLEGASEAPAPSPTP